jgi:hypothetical protein
VTAPRLTRRNHGRGHSYRIDGRKVPGVTTILNALPKQLTKWAAEKGADHAINHWDELAALPLAERREVPGLEPERAPVIVAGAAILLEAMRYLRLSEIQVSERDILDGAALAAAELPEPVEGDAPPGAYTCC